MSSLTRSTRPTLPFLPFGIFSSAINDFQTSNRCHSEPGEARRGIRSRLHHYAPRFLHSRQECSWIIEMRRLSFWPLIEPRCVDNDLPIGSQFDLGAVHRSRGRPFEINSFAVIAAAV